MAYFTESQLRGFARSPLMEKRSAQFNFSSTAFAETTIFLSHSHHDRELAKGIISHFADLGIGIYVDWNDSNMPRETSRETAEKIKTRISELDLFMVLATQNGLNSKWVPWEVGVADKSKGEQKVLIIPVLGSSGEFEGNEYLQLYRSVVIANNGRTAVFAPQKTTNGILLERYMQDLGT